MFKLFALTLFCGVLCFAPGLARAQDIQAAPPPAMIKNLPPSMMPEPEPSGPFPAAALGIWSAPDCSDAQSVIVLSQYYQLHLIGNRHSITAITQWRSEDYDDEMLFFYLTHDMLGFFFKMTNDGLIKHSRYYVHPKQELHSAWDSIIEQMSDEYTRCAKLFTGTPVVTQDEVNLPFLLDRIKEPCAGVDPDHFSNAAACHAALFDTVDTSKDAKLDEDELRRFYKQAVFLEDGALPGCRVPAAEGQSSAMAGPTAAINFAAEFLTLADSDGDKVLSAEEATHGIINPLARPLREPLLQKLRSVRFALGFLPLSQTEKACSTGSPGNKPQRYTGVIMLEETPSPLSLGAPGGGCGCGG